MIQILTYRHLLSCMALTVNDNREVHIQFALTKRRAERKLIKSLA